MTLALTKVGLQDLSAGDDVGELYLADIGVPPILYSGARLNLEIGPLFHQGDIIRLW